MDRQVYVGIAASAGGLEALSVLLQNLPTSSGAVYIVAQHTSPHHKSLLAPLLSRETSLKVVEISDGMVPDPNAIYITPPNNDIVLEKGVLRLKEPNGHPASPKPSGDRLFKSLAEHSGEDCVAIVLSGTGTDGSYGVQAVREVGGITIAQDPANAKYDGMPNAAIETGCIDVALKVDQIGVHLERILDRPRDLDWLRGLADRPTRLNDLLQILLARTRVDFRDYKESTVNRRIARRMAALGIEDYDTYVGHCRTNPEEVDALHRDLLISVTRFFRDPELYEALAEAVRKMLLQVEHRPLRIWVPGVATGEEAYSIAILLAEALGGPHALRRNQIQIFATDIDDNALELARRGMYPLSALADIPPSYRDAYFSHEGDHIEVSRDLRNVILFSHHNIFQDPPFLSLDLISLRNLLIYFNTTLQEKVLHRMHYSLLDTGLLFLGVSETVTVLDAYFQPVSERGKVYSRRIVQRDQSRDLGFLPGQDISVETVLPPGARLKTAPHDTADDLFETLLSSVVTQGMIVTRSGEVVRVIGDLTPFIALNNETGLRMNLRILRGRLRDDAFNLVAIAHRTGEKRTGSWVEIDREGDKQARVVCFPMATPGSTEPSFVMSIEERLKTFDFGRDLNSLTEQERINYLREIEREMFATREALQQTVEELQTSNEELQSSNEELQSTNEELQATNEELETANEELQSTNEELITVNEELQVNAASLDRVTRELRATFDSTDFPMIMVDEALQVRQVSNGALRFLGLPELPVAGVHLAQCSFPEVLPSPAELCVKALRLRERCVETATTESKLYEVLAVPFEQPHENRWGVTISINERDITA